MQITPRQRLILDLDKQFGSREQGIDGATFADSLGDDRDAFLSLARHCPRLDIAKRAWQLIQKPAGSSTRSERQAAMVDCLQFHASLGDKLPLSSDPHQLEERPMEPPLRAIWDYRHATENLTPGQSIAEALHTLKLLHRQLIPHHGWRDSGQAFLFLQTAELPGRTRAQAAADFLKAHMLKHDLGAAQATVLRPPDPPAASPSVEEDNNVVIIGGVPVPRGSTQAWLKLYAAF